LIVDGQLPVSWVKSTISDVCSVNPTVDKSKYADNLLVSFVPMPAVEAETGRIDVSEAKEFQSVKKGYTPFQKDDVLFAKITPCMENGKMAVVPEVINNIAFGSTEFQVLRAFTGVLPKFIYYFVSSKMFRQDAEHNMSGAVGQRRVPKPYLEQSDIPIPPTQEQHQIVAKIEKLFSEIDKGVESLKTAKVQLHVYRQALLKHAFEGKLTAQWRSDNPDKVVPAEELLRSIEQAREERYQQQLTDWQTAVEKWEFNGKEEKKPSKPRSYKIYKVLGKEILENLPESPSGWVWGKLGLMTCGVEYGTSAKSEVEGKIAVLRMGNIQNGKFEWDDLVYTSDDAEIEQYMLKSGDVLFNRTNSPELVGKTALYKGERQAIFAGYLIRVNQIAKVVKNKYLNYYLNSLYAKKHGNSVKTDGVNQSNINGDKLSNYPFPYCTLAEQEVIVNILEEKLSECDNSLSIISCEIKRAEALRQSILKKAFSGQLVPQDPNDEPASELLKRIQAEKADREAQTKPAKTKRKTTAAS
jgi:type I restriction enzyme, S subunit